MSSTFSLFKTTFSYGSTLRFFFAAVVGFAFSIAVILCTVGLMDGFEFTLKKGLKLASGDIIIHHKDKLFQVSELEGLDREVEGVDRYAAVLQLEAMIAADRAQGILIKGVDQSFSQVTGLNVASCGEGVCVSSGILKNYDLKVGDTLPIMLPVGHSSLQAMPQVLHLPIQGVVHHGVYEKDKRVIYTDLAHLQRVTKKNKYINLVSLSLHPVYSSRVDQVEWKVEEIRAHLPSGFVAKPYWDDFSNLLEAVAVEKFSITLILQLIVLVSIFNIFALVVFMLQRNAREFFLFRALGVGLSKLARFWLFFLFLLWGLSLILAFAMTFFFDLALQKMPWLEIPGDVYVLTRLKIVLTTGDYALVAVISLLWIMMVYFISFWQIRKKPLLFGLREEFY